MNMWVAIVLIVALVFCADTINKMTKARVKRKPTKRPIMPSWQIRWLESRSLKNEFRYWNALSPRTNSIFGAKSINSDYSAAFLAAL